MRRQGIAFAYSSPAELYLSRRRGRHTDYRRFATAAEAIRYAVEESRARRSLSAWMQVGEDRFNEEEINRLYGEMIILCALKSAVEGGPIEVAM